MILDRFTKKFGKTAEFIDVYNALTSPEWLTYFLWGQNMSTYLTRLCSTLNEWEGDWSEPTYKPAICNRIRLAVPAELVETLLLSGTPMSEGN